MKKLLLVLSALVFFTLAATAKPVDLQTARQVARNFYHERINQYTTTDYNKVEIRDSYLREENGQVIYYIFNLQGNGFVIVSGDDALTPVIAYSFESQYDEGDKPVQFERWMDNARDQVLYHAGRESEPSIEIADAWTRLRATDEKALQNLKGSKSIEPLLISTWDQGAHYNELCPEDPDGPGGRVYAGCVATAMAQVMFYYRHPLTGNGSASYYSSYGLLSANFGASTYEWDKMLPAIHSSNLPVAKLLLHCGIAVEMDYSPNGSGAYSENAADAMVNYFRYAPTTRMVYKDDYSNTSWANLLKAQLDNKRPMYYHGFGSGGHAFNVDGYQDNDYFHFNWGWSGSYNGYFFLGNLNPGGSNFTSGQGAMIDIYPAGNYPAYCSSTKTITATSGCLEDGSGPLPYQENADCFYLLNPQVGPNDSITCITLKFKQFDTESNHDFLTVYDGPTTSDPVLGTYSGSSLPQTLVSTGNKLLVHFSSDAATNANGWFFTFESTMPEYCKGIATYTSLNGSLEDGSSSKYYNNKTICQYLINPPLAKKITLNFTSFQTENIHDFVEVYAYDTVNATGVLLGKFSGNQLPPSLISESGAMFLIFFTNSSVNAQGWSANYTTQQVGINETPGSGTFEIFPNPVGARLQIRAHSPRPQPGYLHIFDARGRQITTASFDFEENGQNAVISTEALPAGYYLLRLVVGENVYFQKLIKE